MRRAWLLAAALLLTACQSAPPAGLEARGNLWVNHAHPAQGQEPRIRFLVIHYTADDFPTSLATLTEEHVSAHYLIPATPPQTGGKPVVWQLVPESQRAWHAGASGWRGRTNLNDTSIGIELENPGFRRTLLGRRWYAFPPGQVATLAELAGQIVRRYGIAPQNVVGHADIAPLRKPDPGPRFPWQTLAAQGITKEVTPPYFSVKEAVFPFVKFPGVDTILGPEMKSTGEVMGVGKTFGEAFVKSQLGAGTRLPTSGKVFLTVKNADKPRAVAIARELVAMGFELLATRGTAAAIAAAGVPVTVVNKVTEGRPNIVDMMKSNEIAMVINTVEERRNAIADSRAIRTNALLARVTTFTTIFGAEAAVDGMKAMGQLNVISVQEMHAQLQA